MAHTHPVYDTDLHFSIDPVTRAIKNESGKAIIIQHDHNSERLTFEIPKEIDGHDMSLCNVVQIHYLNIDASTKEKYAGIYSVDDLQTGTGEDENIVFGSWLISSNATQHVGSLNFIVRFACIADDGIVEYAWHTAIHSGISISSGIYNGEIVTEETINILDQWKDEVLAEIDSIASGATFTPAVSADGDLSWTNDRGLENPATVNIKGAKGDTGAAGKDYVLTEADKIEIADDVLTRIAEESESQYTQLEYIESTGTQYIDTGFKPNQDTRIDITYEIGQADLSTIGGAEESWTVNAFSLFPTLAEYGSEHLSAALYCSKKSTLSLNKNVLSKNGETLATFTYAAFQSPCNFTLFALNRNGKIRENSAMKLYGCQIYDNDTLVRDFVPCVLASGEAGLFDLVNEKFYGNDGTAAFGRSDEEQDIVISYDNNVKSINHRGYSAGAPENTIPAYIMSKEKGFTYVEADVAFTKDSVAVLLHDSTIDRTSDGSGSIAELTYRECMQYDFGSWFGSEYAGTKIPTLDEFLACCKALGLHPYIELKASGAYTEKQINSVVDAVSRASLKGKVTYISFTAEYLEWIKSYDATARLGYLANEVTESTVGIAVALQTGSNEVFIDTPFTNDTAACVLIAANNGIPMEIWTVNDEEEILSMNPYVTGVTSDSLIAGEILHNANMTYTPSALAEAPSDAVIDLDLLNYASGAIPNIGSGGSAYNATLSTGSSGSVAVSGCDLVLTNDAYFTVPRGLDPTAKWTWIVNTGATELSDKQYQRFFRGNNDVPSVYQNGTGWGYKTCAGSAFVYPAGNVTYDIGQNNSWAFVCDGTNISFYINGKLKHTQSASDMTSAYIPTSIGCGDTSGQAIYYFSSLAVRKFCVYDRALTEEEINACRYV